MRAHSQSKPSDHSDDLLEFHFRTLQGHLIEAVGDDPVGFVVDCTDELGYQIGTFMLSRTKGITQDEAGAEIDAPIAANLIPVGIFADDGAYAFSVLDKLATMAPDAQQHFDRLRYHRPDNEYLVVVIAAGQFSCYQVPSGVVSDGQHRTAIR